MLSTLLICANLLSAAPVGTAPTPADLQGYQDARSKVGADADAHVRLALWCEERGLLSERDKHLALAVLNDPANVTARGLMGAVDFDGRWERPEAVTAKIKADEALVAKLAEYNSLRAGLRDNADAHAKLAQWCEENGLPAESKAHLAAVVRLDPSRESAWKKLGMKKVGGRWTTTERLAAEKAEADAQRKADRRWKPILAKLRSDLRGKNTEGRERALVELDSLSDPRAVTSIWTVFAQSDPTDQETAVRALGRLDGPASSRAIAALSVFSDSPEARRAATETLKRRDGRDFVKTLIDLVRAPVNYEVRPSNDPSFPGELFIDGERAIVQRSYVNQADVNRVLSQMPPRIFVDSVPFQPFGANNPAVVFSPRRFSQLDLVPAARNTGGGAPSFASNPVDLTALAARRDEDIASQVGLVQLAVARGHQQLARDVAALDAEIAQSRQVNERTLPVLAALAGRDLGEKPEAWRAWWVDQQGFVYRPRLSSEPKPVVTQVVASPIPQTRFEISHFGSKDFSIYRPSAGSCFAAGTPVLTREGPRAIESIQVGDHVLSQDVGTGLLRYTTVLVPFENTPQPTFRMTAGNDSVVVTAIHRFWKAGEGWAMTRDLKPGDVLRTAGGLARVESVEPVGVQPVFNLELAEGQTYFVGDSAMLVHDNTPVQAVSEPFDARPTFAEVVAGAE